MFKNFEFWKSGFRFLFRNLSNYKNYVITRNSLQYISILFIIPVNILKDARPRRDMPPKWWILILCFGLPTLLPATLNNLLSLVFSFLVNFNWILKFIFVSLGNPCKNEPFAMIGLVTFWQYLVLIFCHPNLLTHPQIPIFEAIKH